MSRFIVVAVALAACNAHETPTKTSDALPAPVDGRSEQSRAVQPSAVAPSGANAKHFGAAFSIDKSEPLTAAIARTSAPAEVRPGADGDGAAAHGCVDGHAHGKAAPGSSAAPGASGTAELASCAGAVADDSGRKVRVSGTVASVCQKAGCWMVLTEGDKEARIFTKEHGFFLPTHIAGRKAEVEGTLRIKVLTEGFAKHLAEDGGKDPSTVTGSTTEYMMTATGIALN